MIHKRTGFKFVCQVSKGEQVVSMIPFRKGILVACTNGVYVMGKKSVVDKLAAEVEMKPIKFVEKK